MQILKEGHFAYFCTTDENNQSHITPMFFIFDEDTYEIFTFVHSKSKKMRNIMVNSNVCLTVDVRDPDNPFNNRGVMLQGEAVISAMNSSLKRLDKKFSSIYSEFIKKYPVLGEVQSSTKSKYIDFTERLVTVRSKKMVYWRGPYFITVNLARQGEISRT